MAILAVLLVGALGVGAWLFQQLRTQRQSYQTLFDQHAELSDEFAEKKKSLSDVEKAHGEISGRFTALKTDHKKAKERLHQLAKDKKTSVSAPAKPAVRGETDALMSARHELVTAKQQVEQLKLDVRELGSKLKAAESQKPAEPVAAAPSVPAVDRSAIERELRADFAKKLRDEKGATARAKRESVQEQKKLKQRLSRALRDIDKQRGRAENNEKAYQIAMKEVHKAYDMLEKYMPEVRRPFVATPDSQPQRPPRKPAKKAAKKPAKKAAPAEATDVGTPTEPAAEVKPDVVVEEKAPEQKAAKPEAEPKKAEIEAATKSKDKPAEEKPAEDKPAEEKPAEDKPAEEAVVEKKPAKKKAAAKKAPAKKAAKKTTTAKKAPAKKKAAAKKATAKKAAKKTTTAKKAPAKKKAAAKKTASSTTPKEDDSTS